MAPAIRRLFTGAVYCPRRIAGIVPLRKAAGHLLGIKDQRGFGTVPLVFSVAALSMATLVTVDTVQAFQLKGQLQAIAGAAAKRAHSTGGSATADAYLAREVAQTAQVPTEDVVVSRILRCDGDPEPSLSATCRYGQRTSRSVTVEIRGTFHPLFGKLLPRTRWFSDAGFPLVVTASAPSI
ncbi:hypothetical protein NOVOSPHI9U_620018 [Novosphingobium sp. 9U]|nr:hypothetical protein NOVOSPHI9U_620018 [Novosphingobium sp. 9U]